MRERRPVRRVPPTSPEQFVEYALKIGAIELGEWGLRSGRLSPYFFNSGAFNSGESIGRLAIAYAKAIRRGFQEDDEKGGDRKGNFAFDLLYGPPYKGTILAPMAAEKLDFLTLGFSGYGPPFHWCSSRKEIKKHGERGGVFLGTPVRPGNRVLIVDDVITDGATKKSAVEFIEKYGGKVIGLVIALDRQEKAIDSDLSATQEFGKKYSIPVIAVATLKDLRIVLKRQGGHDDNLKKIDVYQKRYGV